MSVTLQDRPALTHEGRPAALMALVTAAVFMGVSPIFVRLADVGPYASAFWRVSLALPLLYAWMRYDERATERTAPAPSGLAASLAAGALFAGDLFFWHLAVLNTTVANATFFATLAPLFVILVTWLVLRRPIAWPVVAGLALCLAGGLALIGQDLALDAGRLLGDVFGVATALFFGLYFLAVEEARLTAGAARVAFQATAVTAVILFVVAVALEPRILPSGLSGGAAVVALAWLSHAGGQGLLCVALGRLPAVFSSLVIFLEAVAAAVLGWIVLGEALTALQMLGGALILGGIWFARPRDSQPQPAGP
jgi:drug/metabolite transporter (DMT)-like permease